jgi:hypothetical protein
MPFGSEAIDRIVPNYRIASDMKLATYNINNINKRLPNLLALAQACEAGCGLLAGVEVDQP